VLRAALKLAKRHGKWRRSLDHSVLSGSRSRRSGGCRRRTRGALGKLRRTTPRALPSPSRPAPSLRATLRAQRDDVTDNLVRLRGTKRKSGRRCTPRDGLHGR